MKEIFFRYIVKRTLKNYSLSYRSHLLDQFYLCLAVALSPFLTIITGAVGAVAQLGERVVRIDEVAGSNPVSSTRLDEISPIILPKLGKMKWRIFYEVNSRRKAAIGEATYF